MKHTLKFEKIKYERVFEYEYYIMIDGNYSGFVYRCKNSPFVGFYSEPLELSDSHFACHSFKEAKRIIREAFNLKYLEFT